MRLCFILEERYRGDSMPRAVATELAEWGHHVRLLEPNATVTCLSRLATDGFAEYDAFVLKTVSNGPGLSILESAGAAGIATVNDWRSIALVRDKAVALTLARSRGLPFPATYFIADGRLLETIPRNKFPLVVKPTNGSSCEGICLLEDPGDVSRLNLEADCYFLAQRYVENAGYDVKVYNTGVRIYATLRRSPLHPEAQVRERIIPLTPALHEIAVRVGAAFGLSVYGVDLVHTPRGWVGIDINDFPSFALVPGAAAQIGETILDIAMRAPANRVAGNGRRSGGARWESSERLGIGALAPELAGSAVV
jgi:ribosomal protein S6--L-glutamate ligase